MSKNISEFQKAVWDFYKENGRKLPWRQTTDPYKITVSEIMLQQTQVSRVLPKYKEFIKNSPNFPTLSRMSFEKVLFLWSGLGYNRRAKYLHETSKIIQKDFHGLFPKDEKILEKLPGLGKATAASIIVFSYNKPLVFIETNIRRVFIHHFYSGQETVSDKALLPFIEKTLDKKDPRNWYYALMDYGSYLGKTIVNPNRKSKHYIKQSAFEGSIRQVRGKILKYLLQVHTISVTQLKTQMNCDIRQFKVALVQLEKEGFVVKRKTVVSIKT